MTHPNYERDRADAQAVYDRLMWETQAIVTQARAPLPLMPRQSWLGRMVGWWRGEARVLPIAGPLSEPLSRNKPAASSESSVSVPKEQQS